MLIGIDVGGTFTDGVIINKGQILKTSKKPTNDNDICDSTLQVLDELLESYNVQDIKRIVISTTLITNIIASEKGEPTALILIPGKGLPHDYYTFCQNTYFIAGGSDFRGRIYQNLDEKELEKVLDLIEKKNIKNIAVVAKFSNRNNEFEQKVKKIIRERYPFFNVILGHEIAGKLNFRRRAVTSYYTAMTKLAWNTFVDDIEKALQKRGIETTVDILKADGGTMELNISRNYPCETVFTGPAASMIGALAITMDKLNSIVIDIGGTTSDIGLIIDGNPLYATKGALINKNYTHINSFAIRSLKLGGDTPIIVNNNIIKIDANREGPAACFGGPLPTITDVFNIAYNLNIGDSELSLIKLKELANKINTDINYVCEYIKENVTNKIINEINYMFKEWEDEPAYRIWEVVNKRKFAPDQIIGIGAAAKSIVPIVAEKMNIRYILHEYSPVANALGACVARPTLSFNTHIDTEKKTYFIDFDGLNGELNYKGDMQLEDAKKFAYNKLIEIANKKGLSQYTDDTEFFQEEQFNMIRGWDRVGKIFEVGIQIKPGIINEYTGVK